MDTYIVRIYRRDDTSRERLVGVVEQVGVEGRQTFGTLEALCRILAPGKAAAGPESPPKRPRRSRP